MPDVGSGHGRAGARGSSGLSRIRQRIWVRPEDARGVTVRATERGVANYILVRQEWASAVSAAAGGDASSLDAALALLRAVEAGLVAERPAAPGRPAALM